MHAEGHGSPAASPPPPPPPRLEGGISLFVHQRKVLKANRCRSRSGDAGCAAVPLPTFDLSKAYEVQVRGYGMSSDGLHLTQPGEDGRGPARCMTNALQQAGLQPSDVAYINAHATSTPLGDAAEQRGIAAAFGAHATGVWRPLCPPDWSMMQHAISAETSKTDLSRAFSSHVWSLSLPCQNRAKVSRCMSRRCARCPARFSLPVQGSWLGLPSATGPFNLQSDPHCELAASKWRLLGAGDGGEAGVLVSSTKGAIGHLLGAAGAVEVQPPLHTFSCSIARPCQSGRTPLSLTLLCSKLIPY